mgnify:CR=1 FL=1
MLSIKKIEPESTKSRGASTTAIEVWGCDKPGLLSEITRLLVDNKLDLSNALVWTHKNRFAMILSLGEPMKVKEAKELQHYLMTSLEGAEELAGTGELWIQVKPDVPERHLERRRLRPSFHRGLRATGPGSEDVRYDVRATVFRSLAWLLGDCELSSHAYSSKICVFGTRHRGHGGRGRDRSGVKDCGSGPTSHTRRGPG